MNIIDKHSSNKAKIEALKYITGVPSTTLVNQAQLDGDENRMQIKSLGTVTYDSKAADEKGRFFFDLDRTGLRDDLGISFNIREVVSISRAGGAFYQIVVR